MVFVESPLVRTLGIKMPTTTEPAILKIINTLAAIWYLLKRLRAAIKMYISQQNRQNGTTYRTGIAGPLR